jgi:hypothetical protein
MVKGYLPETPTVDRMELPLSTDRASVAIEDGEHVVPRGGAAAARPCHIFIMRVTAASSAG